MSTKITKMTLKEAQEELEMNLRQQDAISDKFGWPDLDDSDYIEAEHRLAECQKEEVILIATIDFWEQFEKSLEKKKQKKDWSFKAPKIDFTKDSEYIRLFGE
jgi:hypothetical protein